MTVDKGSIKVVFGILIFMFSLALAYFTANYVRSENIFDYWLTLLLAAVIYIVIGFLVYQIFAVSLGFLFTADILILHLLLENFGGIPSQFKIVIVGVVLVILYLIADISARNENTSIPPTPPLPPINS